MVAASGTFLESASRSLVACRLRPPRCRNMQLRTGARSEGCIILRAHNREMLFWWLEVDLSESPLGVIATGYDVYDMILTIC